MTLIRRSAFNLSITTCLIGLSGYAIANDSCTKPKIAGIDKDNLYCLGDGLLGAYSPEGGIKPVVYDSKGNVVLRLKKNYYLFHAEEGLIAVGLDGTDKKTGDSTFGAGFISQKTGKEVIPLDYMSTGLYDIDLNHFSEGLVLMRKSNNKYGYLNNKGQTIIPFIYDSGKDFSEGLAAVSKGARDTEHSYTPGKYGFIDKTGKTILPFKYDFADSFSEGLATVGMGEGDDMKYGVIDKSGKLVIPLKFDGYIDKFSEGLAAVITYSDNRYGYIDRSGKMVIPYKYELSDEEVFPRFKNGKVEVWDDIKGGYCLNTKGKTVRCDD